MEIDESATSTTTESSDVQESLPACTKTANVCMAKLSHREKTTYRRKKQYVRDNEMNAEMLQIPRRRNNTASRALCKGTGHSRTNCVRLM